MQKCEKEIHIYYSLKPIKDIKIIIKYAINIRYELVLIIMDRDFFDRF
jgi:hypothetical protein